MTNFVPIFPLEAVVYPEEKLPLHVFEPQYKQLVEECIAQKKTFGMPVTQTGEMQEYGTLVQITKCGKPYEDGSRDITVKGLKVFRVLQLVDLPEKKFKGAIVNYPENDTMLVKPELSKLIYDEVKQLYTRLHIENMQPVLQQKAWTSYDLAHKLGLTRGQEYELLCIFNEVQRMEYLRRYFHSIMPEVTNLERLKSSINPN
ncbi:MAG: LON peptidase substrate-binding domain-containing protein [Edaphocola sp.]